MMSQTRVQASVALSMQISFSCSFASSHVLFSWKVNGLTRPAPVATGFSFSMASVNAYIANSLVLSAASSSPELWLSVSDLHPRVQSAVRAFAFGRGGVAAGVDVTVARFKAAIRLPTLGVEKIKQKFEVLPPCDWLHSVSHTEIFARIVAKVEFVANKELILRQQYAQIIPFCSLSAPPRAILWYINQSFSLFRSPNLKPKHYLSLFSKMLPILAAYL